MCATTALFEISSSQTTKHIIKLFLLSAYTHTDPAEPAARKASQYCKSYVSLMSLSLCRSRTFCSPAQNQYQINHPLYVHRIVWNVLSYYRWQAQSEKCCTESNQFFMINLCVFRAPVSSAVSNPTWGWSATSLKELWFCHSCSAQVGPKNMCVDSVEFLKNAILLISNLKEELKYKGSLNQFSSTVNTGDGLQYWHILYISDKQIWMYQRNSHNCYYVLSARLRPSLSGEGVQGPVQRCLQL